MYGFPVHIFTQAEILQAIELAKLRGFALTTQSILAAMKRSRALEADWSGLHFSDFNPTKVVARES